MNNPWDYEISIHKLCSSFIIQQALVQGRLVRSGLQGSPRQATWSSRVSQDLLWYSETTDRCPQHQQE